MTIIPEGVSRLRGHICCVGMLTTIREHVSLHRALMRCI